LGLEFVFPIGGVGKLIWLLVTIILRVLELQTALLEEGEFKSSEMLEFRLGPFPILALCIYLVN
jgi:hypothetical protein